MKYLDVSPCPRCHGSHPNMKFKPFWNEAPSEFNHWAMCPVTKEPLLTAAIASFEGRALPRGIAVISAQEEMQAEVELPVKLSKKRKKGKKS